ncbi:hypothetical protein GZ78_26870 [Endozoicomonas numazuensis]|uniref:Uncharacterized protein n=2 Tax=Endozoicomonas numazuensis TaxID=1137799 RepID=A0A081N3Z4_9GAMM|nr:hypothetical protein GZ78_26870 [Endozoicomonas numazuensis]
MKVYEKERDLLSKPLTPDNVNKLIKCENHAAIYGSGKSIQDRMAIAFVPIRYFIAHSAAYLLVTSHEGFFSDNRYSKESFLHLIENF